MIISFCWLVVCFFHDRWPKKNAMKSNWRCGEKRRKCSTYNWWSMIESTVFNRIPMKINRQSEENIFVDKKHLIKMSLGETEREGGKQGCLWLHQISTRSFIHSFIHVNNIRWKTISDSIGKLIRIDSIANQIRNKSSYLRCSLLAQYSSILNICARRVRVYVLFVALVCLF